MQEMVERKHKDIVNRIDHPIKRYAGSTIRDDALLASGANSSISVGSAIDGAMELIIVEKGKVIMDTRQIVKLGRDIDLVVIIIKITGNQGMTSITTTKRNKRN